MTTTMTMSCTQPTGPPTLTAHAADSATPSPMLCEFLTDLLQYYKQDQTPIVLVDNAKITITTTTATMKLSKQPSQKTMNHRWEQPTPSPSTSASSNNKHAAGLIAGRGSLPALPQRKLSRDSIESPSLGFSKSALPACPQRKISMEDSDCESSVASSVHLGNREINFSPSRPPKGPYQNKLPPKVIANRQRWQKESEEARRIVGELSSNDQQKIEERISQILAVRDTASRAPPTYPARRPSTQRQSSICSTSTTSTLSTIGSNGSNITIDTFGSASTANSSKLLSPEEEKINDILKKTHSINKAKCQRRFSTGANIYGPTSNANRGNVNMDRIKSQRRNSTCGVGSNGYTDMIFIPPTNADPSKITSTSPSGNSNISSAVGGANNEITTTPVPTKSSSTVRKGTISPPPPPSTSPPTPSFTPPPPLVPQGAARRKNSYYTPPHPLESKKSTNVSSASPASTATTQSIVSTSTSSSSTNTSSSSRQPIYMDKVFLIHGSRD